MTFPKITAHGYHPAGEFEFPTWNIKKWKAALQPIAKERAALLDLILECNNAMVGPLNQDEHIFLNNCLAKHLSKLGELNRHAHDVSKEFMSQEKSHRGRIGYMDEEEMHRRTMARLRFKYGR